MVDPMELKRWAERLGYRVRMCDFMQINRQRNGYARAFVIEGGGPHPNPAVAKYADFKAFFLDPDGLLEASIWLKRRERKR